MLKLITHNWSLKLLALAIALAMWLYVVGQDKAETTVEVPVEITGIPADLLLAEPPIAKVQVRLLGASSLIRRVVSEGMTKQVDLTGMGAGEHVYQVLPEDLNLPSGVRVIRVSPARFTIKLARRESKQVPVRPVLKGRPAKGFEVVEVDFIPPKVTITGTKQDLEDVDWVWTVPMDVSGLKRDRRLRAGLRLPRGPSLRLDRPWVEARIKVRPKAPRHPAPVPSPSQGRAPADLDPGPPLSGS